MCFPAEEPETGFGLAGAQYVSPFAVPEGAESARFDYTDVPDPGLPPAPARTRPLDFSQLARDRLSAHRAARFSLTGAFEDSIRAYRDDRLDTMFLEYKPLDEQLDLLKQRLKQGGRPERPFEVPGDGGM